MHDNEHDKKLPDPILARVEAALAATGESVTAFGYRAAGDPALVQKLRKGRRIRKPALRKRIEAEVETLMAKVLT